jgi:hypothetical protein
MNETPIFHQQDVLSFLPVSEPAQIASAIDEPFPALPSSEQQDFL